MLLDNVYATICVLALPCHSALSALPDFGGLDDRRPAAGMIGRLPEWPAGFRAEMISVTEETLMDFSLAPSPQWLFKAKASNFQWFFFIFRVYRQQALKADAGPLVALNVPQKSKLVIINIFFFHFPNVSLLLSAGTWKQARSQIQPSMTLQS